MIVRSEAYLREAEYDTERKCGLFYTSELGKLWLKESHGEKISF